MRFSKNTLPSIRPSQYKPSFTNYHKSRTEFSIPRFSETLLYPSKLSTKHRDSEWLAPASTLDSKFCLLTDDLIAHQTIILFVRYFFFVVLFFHREYRKVWLLRCRSQWPCGLRRRFSAARLLRLWVRIPAGARMFVCSECCVLSGRGLCDGLITRPEESYRLWRVVLCDQETSKTRRLKPATGLWKYNHDGL
jgi:hypothetical protein